MRFTTITFPCTGTIQFYLVPATGSYVIEASGAQGGAGGGPGGRGARVRGTFQLEQGEILKIVVGQQGTPGTTPHRPAGGGGSFVWKHGAAWPLPDRPLVAADGGGSFNAGKNQTNLPGIQLGDGAVTITPVPEPNAIFRPRHSTLAASSPNPFASTSPVEPARPAALDPHFVGFM